MVTIPLGTSDFRRTVSQAPLIQVRNRYFETNPANQVEQAALLARPSLQRFLFAGNGPIRGIYSQPGSFDDALFFVSGTSLYRLDTDATLSFIGTVGGDLSSYVSMAATAAIGSTPEFLYIADGATLWLYTQDGFANSELLVTTGISNGDGIKVGGVYYQWTNGSVDAGAPAGTLANPWLVKLGVDDYTSLSLMASAINLTGTAGVTYSTGMPSNGFVTASNITSTTMYVQATVPGLAGNSITTSTTISGGSWTGSTLGDGSAASLSRVDMPDGLPAVAVTFLASYIIVIPGASIPGYNGRFYWIESGETFIRPLNFATAERAPDPLFGVRTVGDQFWLLGPKTIETWYATGDVLTPFARIQGIVFDHGIIAGTDAQIGDTVILVDDRGAVYVLNGGGLSRVSDNSIEERVRISLKNQA